MRPARSPRTRFGISLLVACASLTLSFVSGCGGTAAPATPTTAPPTVAAQLVRPARARLSEQRPAVAWLAARACLSARRAELRLRPHDPADASDQRSMKHLWFLISVTMVLLDGSDR